MAEEDQAALMAYHEIATTPGEPLRGRLLQPLTQDGHLEAVCIEHGKPRKAKAGGDGGGRRAFAKRAAKGGSGQKAIAWWLKND